MKVLVTGPFGNVGKSTIPELVSQGHQVRCFAVDRRANRKTAKKYNGQVEMVWGDIRRPEDVAKAVDGQEAIVHLAFIIPAANISSRGMSCEDEPELARDINVGGTTNLVNCAKVLPKPPRIVFISSTHVFGRTQDQPPPRRASDPLSATNHYTQHKIECEDMVKSSGMDWTILRLCAVPPVHLPLKADPSAFEMPRNNRIEFLHTRDAGLACANAVGCEEAVGKVLLIGGGPKCQMYCRDFLYKMDDAVGMSPLPDKAYTRTPYPQDWLDTDESQQLLKFQRHSFEDYVEEVKRDFGPKRHLIRAFRPVVRWYLLRQSPYYRAI